MEPTINDKTILNIQEIFKYIHHFRYEEAFLLSSKIMERNDSGDQLFHEWVKSLAEFFSCKNQKTAIQLLEKIKPKNIENDIHFRIINSLMCFYIEAKDRRGFFKYMKSLNTSLHILDNDDLMIKILCNFANGFYEFKSYKEALIYCEKTITIAQKNRSFGINFSLVIMIKIMCLLYLGEATKANKLKKEFEVFAILTNNKSDIKYLQDNLKKFNEEVVNNENFIKKTI
ncbi:hypothetical protein PV797_14685 [Clostridiaceae bacterium M8S5]|nr:hypothetical protein PV797_14685 [Clostridiaceae bacterium M8S5]